MEIPKLLAELTTSELLHPEVMDLKRISDILKQRGVPFQIQTIEKALDAYNTWILPKKQRVYKSDTRVGQRLIKNREFTKSSLENNKSVLKRTAQLNNNSEIPFKKDRNNINWP